MNIQEAAQKVRQHSAQEDLRVLILRHGIDSAMEAMRFVYQENVYRRAKNSEPVQARMGLLEAMTTRLQAIQINPSAPHLAA